MTLKSNVSDKMHDFYHKIVDLKNAMWVDHTGKFRVRSVSGANCIIVTWSYGANTILVRPLQNRMGAELCNVTASINECLTTRGHKPNY